MDEVGVRFPIGPPVKTGKIATSGNIYSIKNMKHESREKWWLERLQEHDLRWEDGDKISELAKTADFVNTAIGVVIELKSEKESKDNRDGNLLMLSNTIQGYMKEASRKFANYPNYRTLLLVELATFAHSAGVVLGGLPASDFTPGGEFLGSFIKNANLYKYAKNIGAIVFAPYKDNVDSNAYYFDNPFAEVQYKVVMKDAGKWLGIPLTFLDINSGAS